MIARAFETHLLVVHVADEPSASTRPADAKELQDRLEATLSPDEAHKISVCVIDVSRPGLLSSVFNWLVELD